MGSGATGGGSGGSHTGGSTTGTSYTAYVALPDEKEIEQMVLSKKKAELLAKYTSESLAAQQAEARALLNKQ